MAITRREFLKVATSVGALAPFSGISQLAWGSDAPVGTRELLVVLFQRGGCDGLSLVAPVSDQGYLDARTPDMRIASAGDKPGLVLDNAGDGKVEFRLHPEAKGLYDLYGNRRLAVIHAAGLVNGTRSHFEAQDMIERGVAESQALQLSNTGWLARSLDVMGANGIVPAVSAVPGLAHMLQGAGQALALPELQNGVGIPGGAQGMAALNALYAGRQDAVGAAGAATLAALGQIDQRLPRGADNKIQNYQPVPGVNYDGNGDLSRGLQAIARLARMEVGLRVACVDQGGWDTHENQTGRVNGLVGQLSKNLAAFHDDMAASGVRVTTVVMTEFGRRLRSNRSNGTDHGHGGVMMVLGDGVQGGRLYGRWPGLATDQLDRGVDLAVTTDYRTVLAEVLHYQGVGRAQIDGKIFPGFSSASSLGLMTA